MTDTKQAAIASNRFALDMYRELADNDENIFFSPWSLNTALAMTYEGARGKTAEEMRTVLHFCGDESTRRQAYSSIDQRLNANESENSLSSANALWVDKGCLLEDDYVDLVDRVYHARAANLNFSGASEEARKTINAWVEEKTFRKITELIPPGILDELTRIVLTNAIYFNGAWAREFDKNQTRNEKFLTGDGSTVTVPMMRRLDEEAQSNYLETEEMQMLQMPYIGQNLTMAILLPRENDIAALENSLCAEKLALWIESLKRQRVNIYIPKFKIETKCFLKENLKNMGMPTAFKEASDFTGMSASEGLFLYISQVIHQAYVNVNEEGTEAAAATAVVIKIRCSAPGPKTPVFRADHPFIFMITEEETGLILFLGRLGDPGKG